MPQIPRLETQVKEADLPNVQISSEAGSRAILSSGMSDSSFRAIGNAAESLGDVDRQRRATDQKLREKADHSWAQDTDIKLSVGKQALLSDPKTGALTTGLGERAETMGAQARKNYEKLLEELGQTADSPERQEIFGLMRQKKLGEMDQDINRHVTIETDRLAEGRLKASVSTYQREAALNYRNPDRVDSAIKHQIADITSHLAMRGQSGRIQDEVAKVVEDTHWQVVERHLANGDDLLADQYIKQHSKELGSRLAKAEQFAESGKRAGEVFRFKDSIMARYPDSEDLEVRREAAKQIQDPKIRKEVDAELIREDTIARSRAKYERDEIKMEAEEELENAGGDLSKVNKLLRAHLTPKQDADLKRMAKVMAKDKRSDADRETMIKVRESREKERLERQKLRDKEHDEDRANANLDRNARLDRQKKRDAEREADRAEQIEEEEDEKPFVEDEKVWSKFMFGMPKGELAKLSQADLFEQARPFVERKNFDNIQRRWRDAKEEAGKPPKSVRTASARAALSKKSKPTDFKEIKDEKFFLKTLQNMPGSGVGYGDKIGDVTGNTEKNKAFVSLYKNLNAEAKAYHDMTGTNPNYDQVQKMMSKLVTQTAFVKKSRMGLDLLAGDVEDKPVGLMDDEDKKSAYVPFDQILPKARDILHQNGSRFSEYQKASKDEQKERIMRAYAAKKRGANGEEINNIFMGVK